MPSLFKIGAYCIYFWSNENNEPIHVHIAVGKPTKNATKVWLTSKGGCIVANNNGQIPEKDLKDILRVISAQFFLICKEWKKHFCIEDINFFC